MLISIIVPVYNSKEKIYSVVKTIEESGITDYEIVLVDDGSERDTSDICELIQDSKLIRTYHQQNSGVSEARNRGLKEATGKYVYFIDDDDTLEKASFVKICNILKESSPDILIFGMTFDYYYKSRCYRKESLTWEREEILSQKEIKNQFLELFNCNALSPVWNKIIKKDLITDNCILFNSSIHEMEDFLFSVECLKYCFSVHILPEALYHYRQAENERGTFNRLLRVDSLNDYMHPFEKLICSMNLKNQEAVLNTIYLNMFNELLRFGDVSIIKKTANDMLNGSYSKIVNKKQPKLFEYLVNGKYRHVKMKKTIGRLRHQIAIRIKYYRSLLRRDD